ncbi:L-aspartate oxidase [Entomobacter blattae]|uniref:L-aspartate oxidase n=1 Tax=Entomobacter blattae TaxID=2762277 RepID=A0A7H1NQE1_9PROT|nr:FAD-binding protein [Entomobacter blattae]QNT78001.1 L-aspartate oxidase [Entomobacter blattae]
MRAQQKSLLRVGVAPKGEWPALQENLGDKKPAETIAFFHDEEKVGEEGILESFQKNGPTGVSGAVPENSSGHFSEKFSEECSDEFCQQPADEYSEDFPQNLQNLPVIIGAGLAGVVAALSLDCPCLLVMGNRPLYASSSVLAQGGIAAVVSSADTVESHVQDTLKAGAGLGEEAAVRSILAEGASAIAFLEQQGVAFSKKPNGEYDLHLEAAHSAARILHIQGDGTGASLMQVLLERVRQSSHIRLLPSMRLNALIEEGGTIKGVMVDDGIKGRPIFTSTVILAGGGAGALYHHTTNPSSIDGQVMACAILAGAVFSNMEFIQFHPTALDLSALSLTADQKSAFPDGRLPLISEAVRGAGGLLVDETGHRFTDELAPRDQVSRAVWAHHQKGHKVYMDARKLKKGSVKSLFPMITATCLKAGLHAEQQLIPIVPAAHYTMGGIQTDLNARTSLKGLWAVGECAVTGLHGANRLASNSLLEAVIMGRRAAQDVVFALKAQQLPPPLLQGPKLSSDSTPDLAKSQRKGVDQSKRSGSVLKEQPLRCEGSWQGSFSLPHALKETSFGKANRQAEKGEEVRAIMSRYGGIIRHEEGLKAALRALAPLARHSKQALIGCLIIYSALQRKQNCGAHFRADAAFLPSMLPAQSYRLDKVWPEIETLVGVGAEAIKGSLEKE